MTYLLLEHLGRERSLARTAVTFVTFRALPRSSMFWRGAFVELLRRTGDIPGARAALTEATRLDKRWAPLLAKLPPLAVAGLARGALAQREQLLAAHAHEQAPADHRGGQEHADHDVLDEALRIDQRERDGRETHAPRNGDTGQTRYLHGVRRAV